MKKFLKIKLTPLLLLLTFFGCGEQEYLIVKYNEVDFNTGKTKYKGEVFTGEVLKYYSEMNDDLDPVYVDTENLMWKKVVNNGKLTELYSYWENGNPKRISFYDKNKGNFGQESWWKIGEDISYFENGKIEFKTNYKLESGDQYTEKEGEDVLYFENGQIRSKVNYVDDEPEGEDVEYFVNGQIAKIKNYVNGYLVGEQIEYFDNGKIKYYDNYGDDGLLKRVNYNKNGTIKYEWIFDRTIENIVKVDYVSYYDGSLYESSNPPYYVSEKGNYLYKGIDNKTVMVKLRYESGKDGEWIRNYGEMNKKREREYFQTKTIYEDDKRISESSYPVSYDEIKK